MHDLTGFQRDILYLASGLEEPYGLAIKEELDEYYEQEINHGRLYPNLEDLVEKGLLRKDELDKRTNLYTLTHREAPVKLRHAESGKLNTSILQEHEEEAHSFSRWGNPTIHDTNSEQ